ncbi:SprT family zinc-dependent metalloprotease [Conservatibacter flavescens]|uniref:Protein SprT n=1 Tax=Conservatibacter flavescens TaxID=28161 RepID=A0A2M8RZR1_9PAST|nr:SprT family zinc-dependent metalloprotease [Conservatibacter flavescens]PJG84377.1 SprT family protein [Conservatibacter flavescens]
MSHDFRLLKLQVQRKLKTCLDLAERHFNRSFPMPVVSYDVRGVKAGVAYLQKNCIKFNRTLLLENPEAFINQVVPHEVAHLIVYQIFGQVKPHGKEWQFVMVSLFQIPADTCHQFDVSSVQGKTYPYRCACQIHQLTVRRHQKVQHERAVYICRKCQSPLSWLDDFL